MGEGRNVYREVKDRAVIRTEDVYQMATEEGVAGYSDTLLAVVANFKNSGAPEGFNAQSMVVQVSRLFGHDRVRVHGKHDAGRPDA